MKYDHFIFDLDGTLVDSSSEIHEAAVSICRSNSLQIPTLEYIRRMTGSPPVISLLIMVVMILRLTTL